jgi:CBS-domain-containing membrane protein
VTDPEECGIDRQVREDEPALKAFRLMRRKGVGGIPVVDDSGRAVGSIMIKDVKHLLTASENRDYRSDFFFFCEMTTGQILMVYMTSPLFRNIVSSMLQHRGD